ncbi:MAG TPA: hypothetical protein PLD88_01565, partial [Candidatus Berkiella sp.]|nr:hypothetical protein [Candidatus Berkiella sp.]
MRYYNYGGRDFLLLHGIPFYKSTGQNSKSAGTWFPFGGVADDGIMIKPGTEKSRHKKNNPRDNQLGTLMEDLKGIDPAIVKNIADLFNLGEFALRFFGIQHLLCSTLFGGGVWNLPEGQAMKNELQKLFP